VGLLRRYHPGTFLERVRQYVVSNNSKSLTRWMLASRPKDVSNNTHESARLGHKAMICETIILKLFYIIFKC
jgi:hypothetical protein